MRAIIGAFAAAACCAAIMITPQTARAADAITVAKDGTVPGASVPTDGTPAVTKVRVLNEGTFLEVYWNEYVDENEAVDPANYVLRNGNDVIGLEAKNDSWSNTLYFDQANKELAATDANVMAQIDPDIHMASLGYTGTIDPNQPLTLEVKGTAIKDSDGNAAADATYAGVPMTNYYTQSVTSRTGIVVKGDSGVSKAALDAAAAQVDVELGLTSNGIGAQMAKVGASLAVFPPKENVYFLPEHRGGFNKTMYAVEGYGGNAYNNNVSSIAERNVLRTRDAADGRNTMYANENILIHEFGHAVKSVGMEGLADQSLSREFQRLYRSRKALGMWPNTYAISNSDEFFATMAAIWFNVMDEAPDFNDGTRSPINTRAELKAYDPKTYAFFTKIFPDADLASPWAPSDMPADRYHAETPEPPTGDMNVAPFADATASYSNSYSGGADAAVDANTSSNWNNWSDPFNNYGDATGPWVQLTWDGQAKLTSAKLVLWADNSGVPQLSGNGKWKLQYDASTDGTGAWADVPLAAGATYGSSYDTAGNEVKFASPITASRLRVVFPAGTVVGIGELEAYGQEIEPGNVPVAGVKISGDTDLNTGDVSTLTATITPAEASDTAVNWASSDESVATVDDEGKVSTLKAGTATITATASGKSDSVDVTVADDPANVAPSATVQASYTNTYLGDAATAKNRIKDGTIAYANTPDATWNNWGDPGTTTPSLTLTWGQRMTLRSARLFLWSDGQGTPQLPGADSWKLQYEASADGSGDWADVALATGSVYGAVYGAGNEVAFAAPVTTKALRVVFADGSILGVSELQIRGEKAAPDPDPEPTPDKAAPVFAGVADVSVDFGASFDAMAGVSAKDDRDGDVTAAIKVSGSVDTSKAGVYELTYSVSDAAGNTATVTRRVTVRPEPVKPDTVKPVISGVADVEVDFGAKFEPLAGVSASDDRDGDVTGSIKVSGSVDTSKAGVYELTYSVSDAAGNTATATRRVTVKPQPDTVKPVISGVADVAVDFGASFDPLAGVKASDDRDGDLTAAVKVEGAVDTSKAGVYTLTYTVSDAAGNTATATRRVTVRAKVPEPTPECVPARFTDLAGASHVGDIEWLSCQKITEGYPNGDGTVSFGGMRTVVRQDMAAFLYRLAGSPKVDVDAELAKHPFTDVDRNTSHVEAVLWLAKTGISKGYANGDGTRSFGGMRTVVRQDMAAFLHRYAQWRGAAEPSGRALAFTDVDGDTSHRDDIVWLSRTGVTTGYDNGDGTVSFGGMRDVVRQDMAAFLHRMSANVLK